MKLKKLLSLFFVCMCLVACANTTVPPTNEVVESKDPFTIQLFYSKTCPHCKQLKNDLLPEIEKEFGSQVTIEQYDIDKEESIALYDSYIGVYDVETGTWVREGLLEGVDEDSGAKNYYIPLMVIGDMYAFMGYTHELKDAYIQDIHLALQGKKLGTGDVSIGRWLFKK